MLEEVLGYRLAKEHSAADWSIRPLPAEMLRYAALDVEVLTELRDALAEQLAEQGKTEWARQEFAAEAAAPPAAAPGRPVAAHLGHPPGTDQARARHRPRAVECQGRDRQGRRPIAAPGAGRPGDHRGGPAARDRAAAPHQAAARKDQRIPRAERAQALGALAGRGAPRPRARRRRAARGHGPRDDPRAAARAPLVRARPGRRRAAGRRAGGGHRGRRGAPAAHREPARTGHGPPDHLGTAAAGDTGDGRRRAGRLRRQALAGGADRRAARGGVPRGRPAPRS